MLLIAIVLSTAAALQPVHRRAVFGAAAGLVAAPPANAGINFPKPPNPFGAKDEDSSAPVENKNFRACGSRMVGTYTDPKHAGCTRRVAQIGGTRFASIYGADEDGIPWVVKANVGCAGYGGSDVETLIVDFSPKGGPTEVVAKAAYTETGGTLTFPDGNVWTAVPCTNPNLKTDKERAACRAKAQ